MPEQETLTPSGKPLQHCTTMELYNELLTERIKSARLQMEVAELTYQLDGDAPGARRIAHLQDIYKELDAKHTICIDMLLRMEHPIYVEQIKKYICFICGKPVGEDHLPGCTLGNILKGV